MPNTTRQEALEHIDTIDMSRAWAGVRQGKHKVRYRSGGLWSYTASIEGAVAACRLALFALSHGNLSTSTS
jgi:hypothetical protein